MAVIRITKENFDEEVMTCEKPVMVDFWAPWCGPCRAMGPVIDEVSQEREDIKVCKLNVDENPELAQRYGVMSIPTIIIFRGGEASETSVGMHPKEILLSLIEGNI
jgi:thioredoxin 1